MDMPWLALKKIDGDQNHERKTVNILFHGIRYTLCHCAVTHTDTHALMHAPTCTHAYTRMHAHTHACTHAHTLACTHAHTHTCMHTHTHTHTHIHTHTHTHTYTHTHIWEREIDITIYMLILFIWDRWNIILWKQLFRQETLGMTRVPQHLRWWSWNLQQWLHHQWPPLACASCFSSAWVPSWWCSLQEREQSHSLWRPVSC